MKSDTVDSVNARGAEEAIYGRPGTKMAGTDGRTSRPNT